MSIGGSLSGISFSGLSSGIDSESIISRLIAIEALPIQRMQVQQQQLQGRMGVLQQLKSRLTSLATSAGALNNSATFDPIKASTSNSEVATITATSGTAPGVYALEVSKLAQAQKIGTTAQSSTSEALNLAGQFVINGKAVTVTASDSLTQIAQRINSAGAGVKAAVINGGEGQAYLTISANKTGLSNQIQVSDLSGGIASSLGLVSGGSSIRQAITDGAAGLGFTNRSEAVGTLMGATGLGPQTVQINGIDVELDLSADSLDTIASKINAAATGATATVAAFEKDGTTLYRLEIAGSGSTPTFTDAGNALSSLGILQQGYGNQLLASQDAEYSLDGIQLTSENNTVSTVIPGATLTLLKANETTPEKSTITLARDDSEVKKKIVAFKDAYNAVVDFIKQNSEFDKDSFASGVLFGDPVARQVEAEIGNLILESVPGTTGAYKNLTQLGFEFDADGKLTLDEAKLTTAISEDAEAVGALFRAKGTSTNNALTYVSSTSQTKPSGASSYEVNITQLATKGSYKAAMAQTGANPSNETLTFNGALFGSSSYQLVLPVGATLADTINRINTDSKLKDLVVAEDDGGSLKITSKKWGTQGNFTVVSNLAAAADNSGIGIDSGGTVVEGVNIAGTINGEEATGAGQFLTGKEDNATTEGLQILYTGTELGLIGTMQFNKGVGSRVNDLIAGFNDSINGLLPSTDKAIQSQIDTITEGITQLQERLAQKQQDLKMRFARMEDAISRVQGQAAQLGALRF